MSTPYVLHYAPDNASLIVRLVLEELRLPYKTRLVDRAAREQEGDAFRQINPAGLIPALETPHGVMFETAAIVLWLADTQGRMAPAPDAPERAAFLSHLFFASNTLHAQLRMIYYPEKYVGPDPEAQAQLRHRLQQPSAQVMTLRNALALMDEWAMARGDDPVVEPTVLDYYLAAVIRWCGLYPEGHTDWFDLNEYPALLTLGEDLEIRPAVHAAIKAEGLGPAPFTNPRYPQPPEGSAT
ncbi:glutathione S-transferase family protein [Aestuariivita boseongensis]|uniref:glutathione S-transferase family protein n=1 Tax=Aestuariivita boseongensis TaxID=1470562 RepID=UPI00067FFF3A|nr:glutathione S-transferase [Aestuariivita boseongensis]